MSSLMDHIHRSSAEPEREPWYINVYEVDRAFGGHEEGGWWYTTGGLVDTSRVICTAAEAHAVARAEQIQRGEAANANGVPPVGTTQYRGGRFEVRAEKTPGADWPAERPHYS